MPLAISCVLDRYKKVALWRDQIVVLFIERVLLLKHH
jgi:hypothetical protein